MSEPITLPIQVARGGAIRKLVPIMFIAELVLAAVVWCVLRMQNIQPPMLQILMPGFVALGGIVTPLIVAVALKPADITISRASVDVTPIPVYGFGARPPVSRSIGDFDQIESVKVALPKGGVVYKIALRAKTGKTDIMFDAPANTDLNDYVMRLGGALNLKAVTNA